MDINQLLFAFEKSGSNLLVEEKEKIRKIINLMLDKTLEQMTSSDTVSEPKAV